MSDGYSFCIQVIWCFGCSRMGKAIYVSILVTLHHSTDCSVVLPQCTEVDRCTWQCSPSAVPTPIDCKALKWFRALSKIAPHVKVPNPHPDPLSAGGVSTWVAVDLPNGVVTGVTNPVPSVGTLWVVPDYLVTAISWEVVEQACCLRREAGCTRRARRARRAISSISSWSSSQHWAGLSNSCCHPD